MAGFFWWNGEKALPITAREADHYHRDTDAGLHDEFVVQAKCICAAETGARRWLANRADENEPSVPDNAYDLLGRPEFYRSCATEISGTVTGVGPSGDGPKEHSYWVPARPLAPSWDQWKALWLVFTGRADVLHWPGQET